MSLDDLRAVFQRELGDPLEEHRDAVEVTLELELEGDLRVEAVLHLVAAFDNMLEGGLGRRLYYLGIDFVREGTNLPKLEIWQEKLLEHYPDLADRALVPETNINLLPPDAISLRIHSVGGWGAITMGKNVVMTANELAGLNVKANPKYGSEKKGQPTSFYATLAHGKIQLNGELQFVDVVLSPDPNVYKSTDPLAGMYDMTAFWPTAKSGVSWENFCQARKALLAGP